MSTSSKAIEEQVDRLAIMEPTHSGHPSLRYDREFACLLDMLKPRMTYLIRHYGLADMIEDGEQACAIAVHRALANYNPDKAGFATHVTWMIKGELQSLRHRVRLDQRRSARTAGIRTFSLESMTAPDGAVAAFEIVDDRAQELMERRVANSVARLSLSRLMDQIGSPRFEREIVWESLGEPPSPRSGTAPVSKRYSSEQRRQIVRRTYRNCAKVVATV